MHLVGIKRAIDSNTKRKMVGGSIIASLLAVSMVFTLGIYGGIFVEEQSVLELGDSQLIGINQSISNSFADYIPYSEEYTANAPSYTVSPGLSNVVNIDQFPDLSPDQISAIEQNGFVVFPQEYYDQIYEILDSNYYSGIPNLITTDAVLHAFHVCYDLALREAEVFSFADLLENLTISMVQDAITLYEEAPDGLWKEAALRNIAYYTIAAFLLDNSTSIHPDAAEMVSETLNLIEDAEEMTTDWFMEYWEDFTQFKPRGHYTRSELLTRFFKAMMWYGRVQFRLDEAFCDIHTRQAILTTLSLANQVEGLEEGIYGFSVWEAIYEPTVFFVGAADDLTPIEYLQILLDVYGERPSWNDIQDQELFDTFVDKALDLRDPMILGSPMTDMELLNSTKGMRLMGQRFIPDSYILGQLVHSKVHMRLMPTGLDIMAAFGSVRAWELLEYDRMTYLNYTEQMIMLQNYVGNMTGADWTQNLYYLWMYSLLPLLNPSSEGFPLFMQNPAWVDKQLYTALGSWTELRHDTILYAKQSYTEYFGGPSPHPVHGFVEPVPEVYSRLASLSAMMLNGLGDRDLLTKRVSSMLTKLHEFLLDLNAISIKELNGASLNSTDWDIIMGAHYVLENVSSFPAESDYTTDTDRYMSVIADVHTDPNTLTVLEEAVGDPLIILAAVLVDGEVVLARGGTFSYYEFIQPMDERLTDEEWREMLDQGLAPSFPEWTESFIIFSEESSSFEMFVQTKFE